MEPTIVNSQADSHVHMLIASDRVEGTPVCRGNGNPSSV